MRWPSLAIGPFPCPSGPCRTRRLFAIVLAGTEDLKTRSTYSSVFWFFLSLIGIFRSLAPRFLVNSVYDLLPLFEEFLVQCDDTPVLN